jgi:glycerophosphoryl diester phosphodiesterase
MKNPAYLILVAALGLVFSGCTEEELAHFGPTKCITHRGNVEMGLENSRTAILGSLAARADGTEFDIIHTRDGIGVVNHNDTLRAHGQSKPGRECPLDTNIGDLTFAEIRENCVLENGDEISTVEEIFQLLSNEAFFVLLDFKDTPSEHTIGLIKKYYAGRHFLVYTMVTQAIHYRSGLTLRGKMPNPYIVSGDKYTTNMENGADGIEIRVATDLRLRQLIEKSKIVGVFDVNDPARMAELRNIGIHFLTTDRISECLRLK